MRNPLRESHRSRIILPERRRGRRYLTLKNAGLAGIAFIVGFILLSLWSQFRPYSGISGDLMQSRMQVRPQKAKAAPQKLTIVNEGRIYGHSGGDSLLLDQPQPTPAVSAAQVPSFEPRASQLGKGQRITISGGSEGVQVHAEPMPAPVSAQPPQPQQ